MERLFEFVGNHAILVSIWLGLLGALIFTESRRGGRPVSPQQATHLMNREEALVLDVRDRKAFNGGHITGATNIPYSQLAGRLGELDSHREKPIIVACAMGQHSGAAGKLLNKAGFQRVMRLQGGINEWRASSFPLVRSAQEKKADAGERGKRKKSRKGQAA